MTMQVVLVSLRGLLHRVPQNRASPGNHTFSNPLYKKCSVAYGANGVLLSPKVSKEKTHVFQSSRGSKASVVVKARQCGASDASSYIAYSSAESGETV